MNPHLNILVIDDESNICEGIKRALQPQGFVVDSAASGQEGLQKIQGGGFGLVLLQLPVQVFFHMGYNSIQYEH